MKTEKFSGEMSQAWGQTLSKPVAFDGTFEAFETYDEVKAANELPSNDEIRDFVNNRRKAAARQKSMNAALEAAGYKKPTLEDADEQYRQMVKVLRAAGKSEQEAAATASQVLNYTPNAA